MSGGWFPITSAPQLVRHWLKWGASADEIEAKLKGNSLWDHATLEEVDTCRRLLTHRRRYEAAAARLIAQSEYPSAEAIADLLSTNERSVDPRTVRRWRDGDLGA